jgi:formylglycine-generating enzyme required for sulfatase activity
VNARVYPSAKLGLSPVYYVNDTLTEPLTAANFVTSEVYVNWEASGYRLPTEGEWEYFTRARTTGPFSVYEPNYSSANCGGNSSVGMYPRLEAAAWFSANRHNRHDPAGNNTTKPVGLMGLKASNPWGLKDVHGNVWKWVWVWWQPYPGAEQTDYLGDVLLYLRGDKGKLERGYPCLVRKRVPTKFLSALSTNVPSNDSPSKLGSSSSTN